MSVPAYYLPPQVSSDPQNIADSFSENLVVAGYGKWYVGKPENQTIALDGVTKIYRNQAIHVSRGDSGWVKGQPIGTDNFYFVFDTPQDLSDLDRLSFIFHAYDRHFDNSYLTVPCLDGYGAISLQDVNGNAVYSPLFQFATYTKPWAEQDITPHQYLPSELTGSASFDWSKISAIVLYIGTLAIDPYQIKPTNGYDIWVDGGPFFITQAPTLPVVQVSVVDKNGNPVNTTKNAQLYNYDNNTSSPITLPTSIRPSAGNWGIEIKEPDFLNWENGSTDKLRKFTVTSGVLSMTATFTESSNLTIPIVVGAVLIGGGLLYLLRKGK